MYSSVLLLFVVSIQASINDAVVDSGTPSSKSPINELIDLIRERLATVMDEDLLQNHKSAEIVHLVGSKFERHSSHSTQLESDSKQALDSDFPTPPSFTQHKHSRKNKSGTILAGVKAEDTLKGFDAVPHSARNSLDDVEFSGASGGYHRAIGGGYVPPHNYNPYNVNWHSYKDDGLQLSHREDSRLG